MKATYSNLMNSRFFNPAFNSAIFDGPVRIYFAQFNETLALKIYFSLRQRFSEILAEAKTKHKLSGQSVLIMLYPSKEAFTMSFESTRPGAALGHSTGGNDFVVEESLGQDTLIGINGPFEDDQLPLVLQRIAEIILDWQARVEPRQEEAAANP